MRRWGWIARWLCYDCVTACAVAGAQCGNMHGCPFWSIRVRIERKKWWNFRYLFWGFQFEWMNISYIWNECDYHWSVRCARHKRICIRFGLVSARQASDILVWHFSEDRIGDCRSKETDDRYVHSILCRIDHPIVCILHVVAIWALLFIGRCKVAFHWPEWWPFDFRGAFIRSDSPAIQRRSTPSGLMLFPFNFHHHGQWRRTSYRETARLSV